MVPLDRNGAITPLKVTGTVTGSAMLGGDFLLVYKLDHTGKAGMVVFIRAGTHSELFE